MEIINTELTSFDKLKLPPTLYKYRDWNGNFDKRVISHREVFYAYPSSFEDKFDCKNPTRWDLLTDEEILNKYYRDSQANNPDLTIEEHMEFAIDWANNSRIKDPEFIIQQQQETFQKFDQFTGVLCLTEYPAESSMWEKYAINHTGFCVGFDPKTMLRDLGTGGGIVFYEDELPVIHPIKHSHLQQSIFQIFYKLKHWCFEKEYRSYKFRNSSLSIQDRTIVVPVNAFKEIILGALMPPASETALLASIPQELSEVKIKKAYFEGKEIVIKDYPIPV